MIEFVRLYYDANEQKMWYEIPFVKGKRHGIGRWWFENGILEAQYKYKDGNVLGVSQVWFNQGARRFIFTQKGIALAGIHIEFKYW